MIIAASVLAAAIDQTLLKPEATPSQIDALCDEAVAHGFGAICVNPVYVAQAAKRLEAAGRGHVPRVVSVAGFPLGASTTASKAEEARRALGDGAAEIDMVVHLGALIAGERLRVRRDIEAVASIVHEVPDRWLKVILEVTALTREQIILGCRCCAEGEADFVKTSTGFHPTGGATVEHVRMLCRLASPMRVKASGGIRIAADAVAMINAGASRIGTSSGAAILRSLAQATS